MPEVGIERDSRPWKHWEVAETGGIRAKPAAVRPDPMRKVWTLSTLLLPCWDHPEAVAGRESSSESTMFLAGNANTVIRFSSSHILHGLPVLKVHDRDQLTRVPHRCPPCHVSQPSVHQTEAGLPARDSTRLPRDYVTEEQWASRARRVSRRGRPLPAVQSVPEWTPGKACSRAGFASERRSVCSGR